MAGTDTEEAAPKDTATEDATNKYWIFISHSYEDQELANLLISLLNELFDLERDVGVVDMSKFQAGIDWRDHINRKLKHTDLFLLLNTGRIKENFGWTGFELGFFSSEKDKLPYLNLDDKVPRKIIPIHFLAQETSTTLEIQGIKFKPEQIRQAQIKQNDLEGAEADFAARLRISDDPIFKLICDIDDDVDKRCKKPNKTREKQNERIEEIRKAVINYYKQLFNLLRDAERDDSSLQAKVVIHLPQGYEAANPGELERHKQKITIDFGHQAERIFAIEDAYFQSTRNKGKIITWEKFSEILQSRLGGLWPLTQFMFEELVRSALETNLSSDLSDQYILSKDDGQDGQLYRAIVTRRQEFYSGSRKIHVYLVPRRDPHPYGDEDTSFLMDMITSTARYRSLFLESKSLYSGENIAAIARKDEKEKTFKIRKEVMRLTRELDLLVRDGLVVGLQDTRKQIQHLGPELQKLMEDHSNAWRKLVDKARETGAATLKTVDHLDYVGKAATFSHAIEDLCTGSREMNTNMLREFLRILSSLVERRVGETAKAAVAENAKTTPDGASATRAGV